MWLRGLTYILLLGNILQCDCRTSIASEAVVSIIENHFAGSWQSKVDLIFFEGAINVADQILRGLPLNLTVKVIDGKIDSVQKMLPKAELTYSRDSEDVQFVPWNKVLRKSSVLLFESAEQYRSHITDMTWLGNRWFRYDHIAYAPNLTKSDVIETTKYGFEIDAVAFLMNETLESIDLVSSFMFTEQKCRHNQLRTINRYNSRVSKWATNDFFPPKYKSFFNCTLTLVAKPGRDTKDMEERYADLAKIPVENCVRTSLRFSYAKHNANTVDMVAGYSNVPVEIRPNEIYSAVPYFTNVVCYMPDNPPYSLLEKMFMMFDANVWIAIGCTLLFWFVSIRVINCLPPKVGNLVYGKNVNTPTMNLLDIFLNGGQHKIPSNKLAKYLLMLFVCWSLIIRTCYQSKLFEYLQVDLRIARHFNVTDIIYDRTELTTATPCIVKECLDVVSDYLNKKYYKFFDYMLSFIDLELRTGKSSLKVHEDVLMTQWFIPTFFEFSPYFQVFNDRVGRLIASGYYGNGRIRHATKREPLEDMEPQILTFDQLQLGFVACLIPFVLSIFVFIIELAVHFVKIQIPWISIFFALKAYERRIVIGPERKQRIEQKLAKNREDQVTIEGYVEEIIEVISVESVTV